MVQQLLCLVSEKDGTPIRIGKGNVQRDVLLKKSSSSRARDGSVSGLCCKRCQRSAQEWRSVASAERTTVQPAN